MFIYRSFQAENDSVEYLTKCTFIEIYNEQIFDLLDESCLRSKTLYTELPFLKILITQCCILLCGKLIEIFVRNLNYESVYYSATDEYNFK